MLACRTIYRNNGISNYDNYGSNSNDMYSNDVYKCMIESLVIVDNLLTNNKYQ
jgi:hypothetical protein